MQPSFPIHPLIVHIPIALIVTSLLFELVGRATDSEWWRKGAFTLLLLGMIGASAALVTGEPDAEHAEKVQRIPESVVEHHEDAGKLAVWVTFGAVVARVLAIGGGSFRGAIGVVALLLHIGAAVSVGIAGYRGGELVYRHGAGIHANGDWIRTDPGTPGDESAERTSGGGH
jgi:uncharacterized membrane protein